MTSVRPPVVIGDSESRPAVGIFTVRPSVRHRGTEQAADREGPEHATYLMLHDENGDERGGMIIASAQASLTLDWSNAEAVELYVDASAGSTSAGLTVRHPPIADLPLDEAGAASKPAAQIGWSSELGSCIALHDSQGRPRIVLSVGADNVPRIQVFDANGVMVRDLLDT